MSYQVHNFQTGETIEAPPINEMDAQIRINEDDIQDVKDNMVLISDEPPQTSTNKLWIVDGSEVEIQIPSMQDLNDVIGGVHGVPAGGRSGQVLSKQTGVNYDMKWVDQAGTSEQDRIHWLLQSDEIIDTVQSIAFDQQGNISSITHTDQESTAVRTDRFTFGTNTITEVRTLSTGQSLTLVTNLTTLVTTVTYSE